MNVRQRMQIIARGAWAVFLFESRRAMQWQRVLFSGALVAFPTLLVGLVELQGIRMRQEGIWPAVVFLLVPGLICGLNLLLWATPAVHAEVEGKTWSYLAVRPGGRTPILLGKYAAAVAWSLAVGQLALVSVLLAIRPHDGFLVNWWPFAAMVALACVAYGSLYLLFGVVFLRRAMIWAAGYTLFFEVIVGMVPALVNRLTVQYHLRNLLFRWTSLEAEASRLSVLLDSRPAYEHVLALILYALALLSVAVFVLRRRPLITISDI